MAKAYLLTGEPQIGKSTTLKKIIEAIGSQRFGGFYTEEVLTGGIRRGFRLITLDGDSGIIADVDLESPLHVGKYGVSLANLESVGVNSIYKAMSTKDFIIIDEIGPMQLYSDKFKQAVLDVLESPKPLVGSIVLRPYPWADDLKSDPRVELYHLTLSNRDSLPEKLSSLLR